MAQELVVEAVQVKVIAVACLELATQAKRHVWLHCSRKSEVR